MFQYNQPNIENMQQYLQQENERTQGDSPNWWSIPPGMSSVRILPPWDPTGRVALPVIMHPIEYKDENSSYTKYNWTCVNKTFNKPCAICDGLQALSASGIDTSKWEASRKQYYFNAIVMHDPTYNTAKNTGAAPGSFVLMKAPKTFYNWIITQITNPMIGDITSITNGIDVYITKEGSGLGTTYNMTLSPNGRTAIPQEYLDKIDNLYNLDDIFSTGFEKEQVDRLVNHLRISAGAINANMNNVVNNMAGYSAPQQSYQQPSQYTASTPVQQSFTQGVPGPSPYMTNTVPQQSYQQPSEIPTNTVGSTNNNNNNNNLPKCFGQYDAGSVNCVICPHELDCSKKSS